MHFLADATEIVQPGGPSAPVWAFLSVITAGILTLIGQAISAKRAANDAKSKAEEASESATKAASNTEALSNGFASAVLGQLQKANAKLDRLAERFNDHLDWHQRQEASKERE